ncbi:hypothetical protein L6R53_29875 [Myxococcota bacterium]|nr:hypothetical protein [Myxococcota bacterium]
MTALPPRRARVATRLRLVGPALPALAAELVELLHPGPGEGFVGPHRRIEGGLLTADGCLLVLPGLLGAAPEGDDLLLASRAPGGVALWRWREGHLQALRTVECSGLHLGGQWLLAWRGSVAWGEQVADGAPIPLPLAAREARAWPWPRGAGATWVDGQALIELASPGRGAPRVLGVADQRLARPRVGPDGACVVEGTTRAWVHAPGGGLAPCELEGVLGEVAFSPDGTQALVEVEEGVQRVDLRTGALHEGRADGRPAGFGWWVDPAGDRHRWRVEEGAQRLPGPGIRLGGCLHGPGGLAWDLRTAAPRGEARTAGADLACRLDPRQGWPGDLLLVEDGEVLLDDGGRRRRLHSLPEGEAPLSLQVEGDLAHVATSGGLAAGGPAPASWSWRPGAAPPLPSPDAPDPGLPALGLPLDGSLVAPDGSTWAWQDDGPLVRIRR